MTHTRTALLVIDAQRAFDQWVHAGQRRNQPDAERRIADLLAGFRAFAAPVLHVRHRGTRAGSAFLPDAPGYAPLAGLEARPDEPVLVKTVNSAFIGTDLERRLRDDGIGRLVICGATTNHCVETTTRMAGNLGFEAWLVRDACWTFDRVGPDGERHAAEAVHAMSLANLHGEFAHVLHAADVLAAIEAERSRRYGASWSSSG